LAPKSGRWFGSERLPPLSLGKGSAHSWGTNNNKKPHPIVLLRACLVRKILGQKYERDYFKSTTGIQKCFSLLSFFEIMICSLLTLAQNSQIFLRSSKTMASNSIQEAEAGPKSTAAIIGALRGGQRLGNRKWRMGSDLKLILKLHFDLQTFEKYTPMKISECFNL